MLDLGTAELDLIIQSLDFTRMKVEDTPCHNSSSGYPSYEYKCQRLSEVQAVITKCRAARKATKAAEHA